MHVCAIYVLERVCDYVCVCVRMRVCTCMCVLVHVKPEYASSSDNGQLNVSDLLVRVLLG